MGFSSIGRCSKVATKDNTDEITEGSSNLYYTNARADARITNALLDEDSVIVGLIILLTFVITFSATIRSPDLKAISSPEIKPEDRHSTSILWGISVS